MKRSRVNVIEVRMRQQDDVDLRKFVESERWRG